MKIFRLILGILALLLIVFNVTKLDFDNLLQGDSMVALICIIAALCALILLLILNTSKRIQQKLKEKS